MAARILPRYPVYVPSKGRADVCYTAQFLTADGVPFALVVEQPEVEHYRCNFPDATLLVLPFVNQGLIAARNWIKAHATAAGTARHWQLDDNMKRVRHWYKGKRITCASGVALRTTEDFVDRYENVAVAGLNYTMFAHQSGRQPRAPFWLNVHVYSCTLIDNALPYGWRARYNDDTDLCLRVLADGYCTVLMNAFCIDKMTTMTVKGGNTDDLYRADGRTVMARSLERLWPGVVETKRRWQRSQHVIAKHWTAFDTPLKLKQGVDLSELMDHDYQLTLRQVKPIKSRDLAQRMQLTEASQEA